MQDPGLEHRETWATRPLGGTDVNRLKWLKQILLTLAWAIGAYLSILYVGGFMVFGFRSFLEFCLFFVPVLTFPVNASRLAKRPSQLPAYSR